MRQSGYARHDPTEASRIEWAYRFRSGGPGANAGSRSGPASPNAGTGEQSVPGRPVPPSGNNWVAAPSVVPRLFSAEECQRIVELGARLQLEPGRMVRPGLVTRRCLCAWMDHESGNDWVYERVVQMVQATNQNYRFDLFGMLDPLQFTRYDSETGDELSWHLDCGEGPNTTRKLSVSVQLSDPDDYDGGDLEFTASPPLAFATLQGAAILFPSFLAHRVTPITRGTRFSLVAFINGPPFR